MPKILRYGFAILMALSLLGLTLRTGSAQSLARIYASYASATGSAAPLFVAKGAGFFKKEGLDVNLVFLVGGARTVMALLSNSVQFAGFAPAIVVQADLKGADLAFLATAVDRLNYTLVSVPKIKRAEDLKGRVVGLTNFGGIIELMARMAVTEAGLNSDTDVSYRAVGGLQAIIAAMNGGAIHATVLNPELMIEARKLGFITLVDLSEKDQAFFQHGIAASRAFVKSNRDVALKFMRAYVAAIAYIKNQPEAVKPIIAKYVKSNDPDLLDTIVQFYGKRMFPRVPYPSPKGLEFIMKNLEKTLPEVTNHRPDEFLDPSIIKEIEASGFIQRLYP